MEKNLYDLLKLGLTEGEAKVYLALSEIGTSTVGPIVKKSGVAYSNVYDILERLIKKGIVSFIIKSKTKHFQAATPKNLMDYLNKKEEELRLQKESLLEVLPKLESLQNIAPKQEAEVFIGKKGLKTAYEKFLIKENDSEYLWFYIHKKRYAKEANMFYFSIMNLMERIPTRGITNEFARGTPWFEKPKKAKVRYADFSIPGNIDVYNDKVLLVSWGETIVSVLINSKDIADNYRKYFNSVWKIAKK